MKALSFVFVTYLYQWNDNPGTADDLVPYQLLAGRSAVAILTMVLWLNCDLKKQVYNDINKSNVGPLIYRTIQGTVSNSINYSVAKYVPSSIIAVVNQLSPIITVVLAFFILKEVVKCFDISIMSVNLVAILVTIFGASSANDTMPKPPISMWIIYTMMVINPFFSSGGTIAMRKMKKFSEYVVSWYLNWSIMLASLSILGAVKGRDMFNSFYYFSWESWVLLAVTGISNVVQQVFRFKALKY